MAEIDPGEHYTADRDNLFRDTADVSTATTAYRRVRDHKLIEIAESIAGAIGATIRVPHFNSVSDVTTPASTQTLITETVPANIERELTSVHIICRQEGSGWIYADGSLIGSVRTGPGQDGTFEWSPNYSVGTGLDIKVDFRVRTGGPIVDIECHLQALDKTIP